jgi:hypothetical protein
LLLAGTAAKADTILTLDAPYQIGPLSVFSFYGTITNTGDITIFLNGDAFPMLDDGLTFDDGPFLNSPYDTLAPGQSTPDFLLFTITAPPYGAGSNFYTGSFALLGGADDQAGDTLATADFNIQVTPEPGSYLLFGTGLLALGFLVKSKLLA